MNAKLVPCVLLALNLVASAVYAYHGDVRHTIYWLAAAVITASVTF